MPLPPIISCFSKIQNGLPLWCRLTQVVLKKRPLNVCSSICWFYVKNIVVHSQHMIDSMCFSVDLSDTSPPPPLVPKAEVLEPTCMDVSRFL